MSLRQNLGITRSLALLTILSFTLTQTVPSWALRADPSDSLRAGLEGTTEKELASGLEEAPQGAPTEPATAQTTSAATTATTHVLGPAPITSYGTAWLSELVARNRLQLEVGNGWGRSLIDWNALTRRPGREPEPIAWKLWFEAIYRDAAYANTRPDRETIRQAVERRLTRDFSTLSVADRAKVADRIWEIENLDVPQARMLYALERHQPKETKFLRSGRGTSQERVAALRKAVGWTILVEEGDEEPKEKPAWLGNEPLWTSVMVRLLAPKDTHLAEAVQADVEVLAGQCLTCGIQALRNYPAPEPGEAPLRGPEASSEFMTASAVAAIDAVYNKVQPGALKTLPAHHLSGHADKNRLATSPYALAAYQGLKGIRLLAEQDELLDLLVPVASMSAPVMMETVDPKYPADGPIHAVAVIKVDQENVILVDNEQRVPLPRSLFLQQYQPTGVTLLSPAQSQQILPKFRTELSEAEMKKKLWCCGIVWFIGDFNGLQIVLDALKTLFYRAPDAAGVDAILSDVLRKVKEGGLNMPQEHLTRRVLGVAANLVYFLTGNPIFRDGRDTPAKAQAAWQEVAQREGLDTNQGRNLSVEAGFTLGSLYGYEQGGKTPTSPKVEGGIQAGDYGSPTSEIPFDFDPDFAMMDELMRKHGIPREVLKQMLRRALIQALRKELTWEDDFVLAEEERTEQFAKEIQLIRAAIDFLAKGEGVEVPEYQRWLSDRTEVEGGEALEPYGGLPFGFSNQQGHVDLDKVGFSPLGDVAVLEEETYEWTPKEIEQAKLTAWTEEEKQVEVGDEVVFDYIPKEIYTGSDGKPRARIHSSIVFEPKSRLYGAKLRLAKGIRIGREAEVRDSSLAVNTVIGFKAYVKDSILGPRAIVRQKAQVRSSILGMGAVVEGAATVVKDSVVGNGAFIQDSTVSQYEIGRNARVIRSHLTMETPEGERIGFFGMRDREKGKEIIPNIAIEIGGQGLWIYPGLTLAEVVRVAPNRLDSRTQEVYRQKIEEYEAALKEQRSNPRGLLGSVGEGTYIKGAQEIRGTLIGANARIENPAALVNATILSDQESPTYIGVGATIQDAILQWGTKVSTDAIVERSMLLEGAKSTHGAVITESIIGYDSEIEKGEVTACCLGAHTASHHRNTMLIALWIPEHGVNFGAGVNIGSNHTGRQADQTAHFKQGAFVGLATSQQDPANYASHTFLGEGTSNLSGKVTLPFSIIHKPEEKFAGGVGRRGTESEPVAVPAVGSGAFVLDGMILLERTAENQLTVRGFPIPAELSEDKAHPYAFSETIPLPAVGETVGLKKTGGDVWIVRTSEQFLQVQYRVPKVSPALNKIEPGEVLGDMIYSLKRNARKWLARFTAKRVKYNFEILQPGTKDPSGKYEPGTVEEAIKARDLLARTPEVIKEAYTESDVVYKDDRGVHTYRDVIGKNYLTEAARRQGVRRYTDAIRLYALTGLKYRISEILKTGVKNFAELIERLAEPPKEGSRWAHEREVLEQEMGKSLAEVTPEELQAWLAEGEQLKKAEYDRVKESREKDWKRGRRNTPYYEETRGAVPGSTAFKQYMWWYDKWFDYRFGGVQDPELLAMLAKGGEDKEKAERGWAKITQLLQGVKHRVPPDFDDDLVRDTFRKIDTEILTTFAAHPEYEEQIEDEFKSLVQSHGGDPNLSWLTAWTLEARANRVGLAYQAAVAWFQKRALAEGAIPQELIDNGTVTIGVMDRLTVQLLPDDDLAHGRWATIALNTTFAAQPVPSQDGTRVVALNGDVERAVNAKRRKVLKEVGYPFVSGNDTETIVAQWQYNFTHMVQGDIQETIRAEWTRDDSEAEARFLAELDKQQVTDPAERDRRLQEWRLENVTKQLNFFDELDQNGVTDPDERAARLTAFQLNPGTSWAVAMSTVHNLPRKRFGISNDRPISIIQLPGSPNLLIASDYVAALGWFPEVDREAARREMKEIDQQRDARLKELDTQLKAEKISKEEKDRLSKEASEQGEQRRQELLRDRFGIRMLELTGLDKFFKTYRVIDPKLKQVVTKVEVSHFNGSPYEIREKRAAAAGLEEVLYWEDESVDPSIVDMGLYEHTAEIPGIMAKNNKNDIVGDKIDILTRTENNVRVKTGLNMEVWKGRFGPKLEGLLKFLAVGYGSSNRASRIFVQVLERLLVRVLAEAPPPPELLTGSTKEAQEFIPDPAHDAAAVITYSGETHGAVAYVTQNKERTSPNGSLRGIVQVSVSGKPASNVFRNTRDDTGRGEGGSLDIRTGPEVTVATVKGIAGQIQKLILLAIQLAQEMDSEPELRDRLIKELERLPVVLEETVLVREPENPAAQEVAKKKRDRMKEVAKELLAPRVVEKMAEAKMETEPSEYDSFIVLGGDVTGYEAELKGEEITNLPAYYNNFRQIDEVIKLLGRQYERFKRDPKAKRTLLIIDDTFLAHHPDAVAAIETFRGLAKEWKGFIKFVVHTAFPKEEDLQEAEADPNVRFFSTPKVDDYVQAIPTLIFYDLFATDLALARGLSYAQANQSKNLTKSVTVGLSPQQEAALAQLKAVLLEMRDYMSMTKDVPFNEPNYRRDVLNRFAAAQSVETAIARGPLLLLVAAGNVAPDGQRIRIGTAEQDAAFRAAILRHFKEAANQLQDVVLLVDSKLGYAVAKGIEYQLRKLLGGPSVRIRSVGDQIKVDRERSLVISIATPGVDRGLTDVVNRLSQVGVATLSLNDPSQPAQKQPQTTMGSLTYPEGTDSIGLYGVAYTYLLAVTVALGELKGNLSESSEKLRPSDFARGLSQGSVIASQLYRMDTMFAEMQNVFRSILNDPNVGRLDRLQIISGRQSYGSAVILAYYLNIWAGVHAEVLLLDESYHGPLAVIPEVPVGILSTDDRATPQTLYDAGVNKARYGNVTIILQQGDETSPEMRNVRPNNIIRLPKLPDPLVNPVDGLFAQLFALQWAQAIGRVYGLSEAEVSAQINDPRLDEVVRRYDQRVRELWVQPTPPEVRDLLVASEVEEEVEVDGQWVTRRVNRFIEVPPAERFPEPALLVELRNWVKQPIEALVPLEYRPAAFRTVETTYGEAYFRKVTSAHALDIGMREVESEVTVRQTLIALVSHINAPGQAQHVGQAIRMALIELGKEAEVNIHFYEGGDVGPLNFFFYIANMDRADVLRKSRKDNQNLLGRLVGIVEAARLPEVPPQAGAEESIERQTERVLRLLDEKLLQEYLSVVEAFQDQIPTEIWKRLLPNLLDLSQIQGIRANIASQDEARVNQAWLELLSNYLYLRDEATQHPSKTRVGWLLRELLPLVEPVAEEADALHAAIQLRENVRDYLERTQWPAFITEGGLGAISTRLRWEPADVLRALSWLGYQSVTPSVAEPPDQRIVLVLEKPAPPPAQLPPGGNPPVIPPSGDKTTAGLEEGYVPTWERFEMHRDQMQPPVTVGVSPGEAALLQWSAEEPSSQKSQFAMIQVSQTGDAITLLDLPGEQFEISGFRPGDSQGLPGLELPTGIKHVDWSKATEVAKNVVFQRSGENPVPVEFNALNRYISVQFPGSVNFLLHRLQAAGPPAQGLPGRAGLEQKVGPAVLVDPGVPAQGLAIPENIPSLAADLQRLRIEFPPGRIAGGEAVILDLTVDEEGNPIHPGALLSTLIPRLPDHAVVILSKADPGDLSTAIQAAGPEAGVPLNRIVVQGDREFTFALQEALGKVPEGTRRLQIYSGQARPLVESALAAFGGLAFEGIRVLAPTTLDLMLQALGVDEATRVKFWALFQRAQENWAGLEEYL